MAHPSWWGIGATWLSVSSLILLLAGHYTVGNWRAVIGAVGVAVAAKLVYSGYMTYSILRQEAEEDLDIPAVVLDLASSHWRQLVWGKRISTKIVPGFWIGVTAQEPLGATAVYLLAWELIGLLDGPQPREWEGSPLFIRNRFEYLLRSAVLLLAATAVGAVLRAACPVLP